MAADHSAASPTPTRCLVLALGLSSSSDSHLLTRKVEIQAALRHELVVIAGLRDAAFLENNDHVRLANRTESMRDRDRCSTGHDAADVVLNRALGFGIERRRCFVENQDRRVVIKRARDR